MRKILFITFSFLLFSCNTTQEKSIKWTDIEKDEVFKECIEFAIEVDMMDTEQANKYCYCTLDILLEKFESKQIAEEQYAKDPSIRGIWYEGCK